MFDKYVRNVRAVSAMSQQVNVRREVRAWIKQQRTAAPAPTVADRALPEYVMHKGHPRYGETKEVEEKHEHEGITDDEEDSEGGDGDDEGEGGHEEEEEDDDDDEREDQDEEEDEDEDDGQQAHRRRRGKRHRRRKGGADELDESEDEKTEERIVAEKVLRVFINKTIGLQEATADPDAPTSTNTTPPVDLISPTSATLTTPLPASALLPVDPSALEDGSPLDADEEQAAKAIVSTRDGRNAFATIFSSLSPNFHASHLPKSLFFSYSSDPPAHSLPGPTASSPPPADGRLTLSRASFNALSALTTLFFDASHATYHIEPAIFVANVAHQIVRQPASHTATTSTSAPLATSTQPSAAPAVSPSDDVMRKEEVDYDSSAKPMTLLAALSIHPLLKDARFYSTALFASLHHAFAHSSLYLHRWYSDEEQEDVEHRRKAETVAMLGRYERMMRDCGVMRRERKRFVEKQVRVFDLLGKEEWKAVVLELMKRNERGSQEEEEEEDGEEEADSPLSIEGLRELASDSEEERQNTLLKRKEEERRAMAEERRKRKKLTETDNEEGSSTTKAAANARKKREEEERKKREEEEKERERKKAQEEKEKKKSSASSFLAHSISSLQSSWFAHRTPSPSPTQLPSLDAAARDRKSSGATAASTPPVAASAAGNSVGVRIPIPVAAAVPPPVHISPGAAAKTASAAASKAAPPSVAAVGAGSETGKAATAVAGEGNVEGGEVKKKKVVRRKKTPPQDPAPVPPAISVRSESNSQADVDDMP